MTDSGISETQEVDLPPLDSDPVLEILAMGAQEHGLELGLTLTVGGSLITGTLVGRDRWFRELGDWMEQNSNQPEIRVIADSFGNILSAPATDGQDEPAAPASRYGFIHLIRVQYVLGATLLPTAGFALWRGRLSEVSGFSVGTVSAT